MSQDEATTERYTQLTIETAEERAASDAVGAPGGTAGAEEGSVPEPAGAALTAEQLGRLRETLVAANPEAVPELIAGADFDALLASVAPARAAYARVREVAARAAAGGVPRGGGVREVDTAVFAGLSPEGKIAAALGRGD